LEPKETLLKPEDAAEDFVAEEVGRQYYQQSNPAWTKQPRING
jgi:hypothetical protein